MARSPLSLGTYAAPEFGVRCHHPQRGHQRVREGPAATTGATFVTGDATQRPCAYCHLYLNRCWRSWDDFGLLDRLKGEFAGSTWLSGPTESSIFRGLLDVFAHQFTWPPGRQTHGTWHFLVAFGNVHLSGCLASCPHLTAGPTEPRIFLF